MLFKISTIVFPLGNVMDVVGKKGVFYEAVKCFFYPSGVIDYRGTDNRKVRI